MVVRGVEARCSFMLGFRIVMRVLHEAENSEQDALKDSPCASFRIAYVMGGEAVPGQAERVEAGQHPRVEYHTFLSRNQADIITFKHLPDSRSGWVKLWRRCNKQPFALAARVIEHAHKYDAILVSGEDIGFPMALGLLTRRHTTPVFIIIHGSYFGSKKFRHFAKLLHGTPHVHFLCLSESLRRQLTEDFEIPKHRVHNPGYGVDTNFFRPKKSDESPVIASAGTASRDYKTLVQASEGLSLGVVIAVDSAWFPTTVDIAHDDIPSHVEARSYGDYVSLRDLYSRAAVVVVPLYTAKHACGYAVIAEAMAMGKCVISTHTDSKSDFIVHGETGFYVPVRDPAALREILMTLLADPDRIADIGSAARRRMEEEYSLEAYCSRIEKIIASTVKRP